MRAIALLIGAGSALAQPVIYVNENASSGGDGTSWETAFRDLQDALEIEGDEWPHVWIARGTYRPDRGTGDREASFEIGRSIHLYGGFAGTETSLEQRDIEANPTILSGDLLGDDTLDGDNRGENSYQIVHGIFGEPCVVDGFIIEGGFGNGESIETSVGGGMMLERGDYLVSNCVFRHNSAQSGAALYLPFSSAIVDGCDFVSNWTLRPVEDDGNGGAVLTRNDRPEGSQFRDCRFFENEAHRTGGAVFGSWRARLRFDRCAFTGNSAEHGGAIGTRDDAFAFVIEDCDFVGNEADGDGGHVISPSETAEATVLRSRFMDGAAHNGGAMHGHFRTITDSTFLENHAFDDGGALYLVEVSEPTFEHLAFIRNTAQSSGGAVLMQETRINEGFRILFEENASDGRGGAIATTDGSDLAMQFVTFAHNSAPTGGAVDLVDGDFRVNTGLFHHNVAARGAVLAAGDGFGTTEFVSTTIANNVGTGDGSVVHLVDEAQDSDVAMRWSIVQGNSEPAFSGGVVLSSVISNVQGTDFDEDPRFVDPSNGDFRLGAFSTSRDRTNRVLLREDLAGNERPIDDPWVDNGGLSDLGALESQSSSCPVDLNGDLMVNIFDVLEFLDEEVDWNEDGEWNIFDVIGFVASFGAGC